MNSKLILAARILLGIMMVVFGLNKFLNFIPMPPIPGDGGTLMGIYFSSGFLKIIGVIEVLGGLALLVNKYVPLATIFLIAVLFNAVVFHILHNPEGILFAAIGLILGLILVFGNKERFASVLSP